MDLSVILGSLLSIIVNILTPPKYGNEVVSIPNGTLEGYTLTSRNGRVYKAFTGIPYARPPVGRLRFKDPLPAEPWEGVLSAKRNVRCVDYQALQPWSILRIADGQEDCLTLNVYTHDTSSQLKKPVLFYIHGGSFELRIGPMLYLNPTYFMDYDMELITGLFSFLNGLMEIRFSRTTILLEDTQVRLLQVARFLSFEDDVVPGNMGLKDQNLALRWVYENIAYFGGDPSRITLMGESAGSVSCHYHAIMPKSRAMVSQVILQSGFAYSTWGLEGPGNARKKALKIAEWTGCKRPTSEKMLKCLQNIDPREIVKLADNFRTWWDRDPLVLFRPVIEKPGPSAFITDFPYDWPPVQVPALMGVDQEDGLLKTIYFKLRNYDFDYVSKNLAAFLPPSLMFDSVNSTSNPTLSTEKILRFYFGGRKNVTEKDEPIFVELYSDGLFRWPLHMAADRTSNQLYLYVNNFTTDYIWIVKDHVFHVQEIFFLWEPELMPNRLTGEDLAFSELIVSWWSNFVLRGNPNKPGESLWKPSSKNSHEYLHMLNSGSRMVSGLYETASAFWSESGVNDRFRIKPSMN